MVEEEGDAVRHSDDSKLGGGDRWENVKQGRCKILAWYVLIAEGEGCLNVRFLCPLSATWKSMQGVFGREGRLAGYEGYVRVVY